MIDLPSLANVNHRRTWHLNLLALHVLVRLLLEHLAFCAVISKGVLDCAGVVLLVSVAHARDILPFAVLRRLLLLFFLVAAQHFRLPKEVRLIPKVQARLITARDRQNR